MYLMATPVRSVFRRALSQRNHRLISSFSFNQKSSFNSSSARAQSTSTQPKVQVPPPPSWSISELRLISTSDKAEQLSEEELATLARRCLIDVRRLTPERREQLRIDVAGVMRCASVLLDVKNLNEGDTGDGEKLTDVEIYDAPRGLRKIPIRRDAAAAADCSNSSISPIANDVVWEQAGESRAVLQSESVQSKLVEDGEEKYFSVVTKRE